MEALHAAPRSHGGRRHPPFIQAGSTASLPRPAISEQVLPCLCPCALPACQALLLEPVRSNAGFCGRSRVVMALAQASGGVHGCLARRQAVRTDGAFSSEFPASFSGVFVQYRSSDRRNCSSPITLAARSALWLLTRVPGACCKPDRSSLCFGTHEGSRRHAPTVRTCCLLPLPFPPLTPHLCQPVL